MYSSLKYQLLIYTLYSIKFSLLNADPNNIFKHLSYSIVMLLCGFSPPSLGINKKKLQMKKPEALTLAFTKIVQAMQDLKEFFHPRKLYSNHLCRFVNQSRKMLLSSESKQVAMKQFIVFEALRKLNSFYTVSGTFLFNIAASIPYRENAAWGKWSFGRIIHSLTVTSLSSLGCQSFKLL